MKNKIQYLLLLPLLCIACVDQIEIPINPENPVIVVDGIFTNLEETQLIKISESIALESQVPIPVSGALIYVEDQDGNRISFTEQEEGNYTAEARAEAGNQYRLVGTLPDGREITTELQETPESFPLEDVRIVDTLVTITDESGDSRRIHAIDFYASGAVNSLETDKYLRFSHETVYQIREDFCSPFVAAKTCYVYNDVLAEDINLVRIEPSNAPVGYNKLVHRRRIDRTMGELFGLDLRLYSYNKKEFDYWENLKLVFDQNGNITDNIPARIEGNVRTSDGSEIQGQFAVVGKTGFIKLVANADFPTIALPVCGIPGFRPNPRPAACCSCLVLKGATLVRPEFWP